MGVRQGGRRARAARLGPATPFPSRPRPALPADRRRDVGARSSTASAASGAVRATTVGAPRRAAGRRTRLSATGPGRRGRTRRAACSPASRTSSSITRAAAAGVGPANYRGSCARRGSVTWASPRTARRVDRREHRGRQRLLDRALHHGGGRLRRRARRWRPADQHSTCEGLCYDRVEHDERKSTSCLRTARSVRVTTAARACRRPPHRRRRAQPAACCHFGEPLTRATRSSCRRATGPCGLQPRGISTLLVAGLGQCAPTSAMCSSCSRRPT